MNQQTKVELYQSCAALAGLPQVGPWLRKVGAPGVENTLPQHLRPRALAEKYGVSLATITALSMTCLARAISCNNYHIEGTMRSVSSHLPKQLTAIQEKTAFATLDQHEGVLIRFDTDAAPLLEDSLPALKGFYHFQKHPFGNQLDRGLGPFESADQALCSFHMEWAHETDELNIGEYDTPEGVSVTPAFADGTLNPFYLFSHEDGRRWTLEPPVAPVEVWRFCQVEPVRQLVLSTTASTALEILTERASVAAAMGYEQPQNTPSAS